MFRPILFKEKSVYELILMKNRHEELTDIPIEFVNDIVFEMGTYVQEPTKITLTIPSHLERNGKLEEVYVYNAIKGKMQLKLFIDDKQYMFSIEEESVTETDTICTKQLTAYERQYKFNNTDFYIATDVATRQLYKPSNETSEVADGMLNWFEQQTGWTVRNITDKARKEIQMCSETERVDLGVIDKTVTDVIINNMYVNISALDNKPLKMKIVAHCQVYDANNREYTDQTLTFEFKTLPYPVRKIDAKYVSTKNNFYGIEFTLTHDNGNVTRQEFPFVNCKNLRLVMSMAVQWELGNLVENQVTKFRTFDTTATNWMDMLNKICEAFDVIILFDSANECIDVCHREEFGEMTNIALTYDNAVKEITKQRKLDQLVTRLTVESSNTSIASVNVLGTDYVECFDYFIDNGIMSNELQHALSEYDKLLVEKDAEFSQLLLQKHEKDQALILANSQLVSIEGKYTYENTILTAYVKDFSDEKARLAKETQVSGGSLPLFEKRLADQKVIVANLEQQVKDKLREIQTLKDECASLDGRLTNIGIEIQKENAVYGGIKLFNNDLLKELSDYIIEKAITDDVHLTALATYNYTKEQIKKYQKPIIDFSIDSSVEFIKRTGQTLSNCIFLGAKMEIEDKGNEITNADGTVSLYGFTIDPNKDDVSSLSFTNGAEAPESALKSISKTTQTVKATKSLTDYYKAVWQQISTNVVDLEKILNEGLDLAAQKVRSQSEKNIIDMSEAGIFLIDAENNDEQLALINDLIAMTDDRWETCRVAISPEGIMAEELIGKIIIGEKLYLGNGENSFKVDKVGNTYGIFISNIKDAVANLRIFLGLDKNNRPSLQFFREGLTEDDFTSDDQSKKDQLTQIFLGVNNNNETTLIMKNETNNQIVISPNGMFSCYQVNDRDNFDYTHPFKSYFYIPSTLDKDTNSDKINVDATLIVRLEHFRAFSRTAQSKTIDLKSTNSTKFELQTTNDGDIECNTTETTSFEAKSTTSGADNINTTETKSFDAVSTGGSGTVDITMSVSLSGLSGSAGNASVAGTSGTYTYLPDGYSGNAVTSSGPKSLTDDMSSHWHTVPFAHGHNVNCGSHSHSISVSGSASGSGSADNHTHKFTVPTHSHGIKLPGHTHKFTVPTHSHGIKIPSHSHKYTIPEHAHTISMPPHSHEAIYGIYETNYIPTCSIYINGTKIADLNDRQEKTYTIKISASQFQAFKTGTNEIEIRSTENINTDGNTELGEEQVGGLCRGSFTLFWGGYYNYN